jgi:hypothetical protein
MGGVAEMLWTDPPYGVSYADKNAFLNAIDKGNRIQSPISGDDAGAVRHGTVLARRLLCCSQPPS